MGGSGGFGVGRSDPGELARKMRATEAKQDKAEYEAEVEGQLTKALGVANSRDTDANRARLEEVKRALEGRIDGTIELLYGGSVAKHTHVDGLSDVDSLALINDSELHGKGPEAAKEAFYRILKSKLKSAGVEKGTLAVTVRFPEGEFQFLPAVKTAAGYRIADASGKQWRSIDPKAFAEQLSSLNRTHHGKLVPAIKIAKAIIAGFPENRRMTGYHLEALALEIFRGYRGEPTTKQMTAHFFREAPDRVLRTIPDRTNQSTHVDEYLGRSGSLERQVIADSLGRVGRRLQNADGAQLASEWGDLIGLA